MGFLHQDKWIVGYDLGEQFCQISYRLTDGEQVETLSAVAGEEDYNIPVALCKRIGVNQWYYGKEALRCAEEGKGILVENLLQLALDGEPIQIDENTFEPCSLLALFLKRSLGLLSQISSIDRLQALMITCEKLNQRIAAVIREAVDGIHLKTDRIFLQNHTESFYHYMLYQPRELWKHQSLVLEYRGGRVYSYRMECNRRTTPVVVFMDCREFPMAEYEPMPESEQFREEKAKRLDREFLEICMQSCGNNVSSVYLIGENYSDSWMKESLSYLCRGRRVFQGTNLYSKGACLAMAERLRPSDTGREFVFLGSDKLKANVGMRISQQGEESYCALLDAGVNWYEADATLEFYIRDENVVELQISSLIVKNDKTARITLEDLPEGISRLRLHLFMTGERTLVVEMEDMGFGSFRPATGRVWREQLTLS